MNAGLSKPRFYEVALTGAPVYLDAKYRNGSWILGWPLGNLLEAPTLARPWITNQVVPPHTNTSISGSKFYRVRVP